MTISAIVMMVITMVVVWGGFIASIVRLQMISKHTDTEDE